MISRTDLHFLLKDKLFLTQQAQEFSHKKFNSWAKGNFQTTTEDYKKAQVIFAVQRTLGQYSA
jgi:hypothetical protein